MLQVEFAAKWDRVRLRERQSSQEHFIDLCRVLGLPTPAEADPLGDFFTFDQGLKKESGEDGFADVWLKDYFAWEYKGRHKDLAAAYSQLQLYRDALGNPPEDTIGPTELKRRTLTNLYNERPAWVDMAHKRLDEAVSLAYGWDSSLPVREILERLLALNMGLEPVKNTQNDKEDS